MSDPVFWSGNLLRVLRVPRECELVPMDPVYFEVVLSLLGQECSDVHDGAQLGNA